MFIDKKTSFVACVKQKSGAEKLLESTIFSFAHDTPLVFSSRNFART
jgi:hypothetical protein